MMPSEKRITRENALDVIKQFAKEYRKELGKVPGEIIIVGGGSIMLNYGFRDATQDFDVILKTVSGIRDVIARFADEQGLPADWMNSDFMKTASYSDRLAEVSRHYCSLNNNTLEVRTVSGIYLIAMKLRSHREYRNDISDICGVMLEEAERGNHFGEKEIADAYRYLYGEAPDTAQAEIVAQLCTQDPGELKKIFERRSHEEKRIGSKIVSYIEDGAAINTKNVDEVIAKMKRKMEENGQER